jgi:membrane protein DedA with SNARE-associated domain
VHVFYERHGRSMVFWCRFIPLIRGVSALAPGISRMQKRYFITYTALGSGIVCFGLAALGYAAGHNIGAIAGYVHDFARVLAAGFVVVVIAGILIYRVRRARYRSEAAAARRART